MAETYGITHRPLLATVQANRRRPGEVVAFLDGQLCFFERGTPMPRPGETVEVMVTRPVHPKDDAGYYDHQRLTGLMVQVVDRTRHMLVALDGFECSGSMCATSAFGTPTEGLAPVRRDQVFTAGPRPREMRPTYTVTPGRSGVRFADNVNVRYGDASAPRVATNVWVDRDPRSGEAQRQVARGGNVRVAGLTRVEDLECAGLVRRSQQKAA
jgi:hypothetical protein